MSVNLRFMMDKVAWGSVFLRVLQFDLSVSFHQCYTLLPLLLTLFYLDNWHLRKFIFSNIVALSTLSTSKWLARHTETITYYTWGSVVVKALRY
jgi:hypothetical protein